MFKKTFAWESRVHEPWKISSYNFQILLRDDHWTDLNSFLFRTLQNKSALRSAFSPCWVTIYLMTAFLDSTVPSRPTLHAWRNQSRFVSSFMSPRFWMTHVGKSIRIWWLSLGSNSLRFSKWPLRGWMEWWPFCKMFWSETVVFVPLLRIRF